MYFAMVKNMGHSTPVQIYTVFYILIHPLIKSVFVKVQLDFKWPEMFPVTEVRLDIRVTDSELKAEPVKSWKWMYSVKATWTYEPNEAWCQNEIQFLPVVKELFTFFLLK